MPFVYVVVALIWLVGPFLIWSGVQDKRSDRDRAFVESHRVWQ